MSKFGLFLVAFALAAGTFWLTVLTDPPKSEAAAAPTHRSELASADQCVAYGVCP